ncbi:MAG TPA: alkaline phosphatase family protein [Thermoanaerobaculia bacterium]|nr:alkaline phosphatase family protein [Thermoanaerobaculia bacterium]
MNLQSSPRGARGVGLAALLFFLVLPCHAAPAPEEPVKLVVVVSIDGLSWPRLASYRPWYEAGFKRLLGESQVQTSCFYRHLNTETGPGHASLSTGAPPNVHGIVANRWFEANPNGVGLRRLYCTDQPDPSRVPGQPPLFYREVEKEGRIYVFALRRVLESWEISGEIGAQATTRIGAGPNGETLIFDSDDAISLYALHHGLPEVPLPPSGTIPGPANLRIPTLGDRLVEASPGSRVVSLSGKDRGAIFLAGKDPRHLVYWYDREAGRFVASPAYDADTIPGGAARDLVRRFNQNQAGTQLVRRFGTIWRPLPEPPGAVSWPRPEPNLARFQTTDLGLGFDHDLALDPRGYFNALYGTPWQDQLLTDLALAALSDPALALGRRGVPDLLALSFSAHDVVSHSFGNESEEELDALRRLDRDLGRLLAALDTLAAAEPRGRVVLALSSDHGFSPLPEVVRRASGRRTGGRLQSADSGADTPYPNVQERLNRALSEALCLSPSSQPIFGIEGWTVAYDRAAFPAQTVEGACGTAGHTVTVADLDRVFPEVTRRLFMEEIEDVLLISQRDHWPADHPAVPFARNDFDLQRSGDAFLVPREHVLMHWDPVRGSGHGSHHECDTHVPVLFWGQPFLAREADAACTPYDLAVTMADVLGVRLPEATGTSHAPRR